MHWNFEVNIESEELKDFLKQAKRGAEKFGVEKLTAGDRVSHAMFGAGVIVSSRDMGGDVLYEVRFDNGQTKKLMATFAKLKKI